MTKILNFFSNLILKTLSASAIMLLLFSVFAISEIKTIAGTPVPPKTTPTAKPAPTDVIGTATRPLDGIEKPGAGAPAAGGGDTTGFGGLQYLQLSNFDCVFKQDGCNSALYPALISFLQGIAPFVATLFIIFGGFEWINDKDIKKTGAGTTILAAIGGYVVVMLAPKLVEVVKRTFSTEGQIDSKAIGELLDMFINFGLNLSTVGCVVALVIAGYSYFIEYYYNERRQQDKVQPNELIFGAISGLIIITLARPIIAFIKTVFIGDAAGNTIEFQADPIVLIIQNFLVRLAIPLSSIIAVVFIVAAGYLYMTAQGDEKKVAGAKSMLFNAVIGIVIVLLCTTITQIIVFFIKPTSNFIPVSQDAVSAVNQTRDPKSETKDTAEQTRPSAQTTLTNPEPTTPATTVPKTPRTIVR